MKRVIHYNADQAGRLLCDACGHKLSEPLPFTPALIGHPCQICGADMLTERDYRATRNLFGAIDFVNAILGPIFGTEQPPADAARLTAKATGDSLTIKRAD